MKVAAIITEYNPFHKGHAYQLSKIDADYVVAIMSGNYVQRGEPALLDKWTRTEMALQNGIDLVLELPVVSATASAEYFGSGAVFLLEQSQIINELYFGAEHSELTSLIDLATILSKESPEYRQLLQSFLKQGNSFPAAREQAIASLYPDSEFSFLLKGSNNILAIEYLKALQTLKSTIRPVLIQRKGQNYLDPQYIPDTLLSASAIRKLISGQKKEQLENALPKASFDILQKITNTPNQYLFPDCLYPYLRFLLTTRAKEEWSAFQEITPELFNRLYRNLSLSAENETYIDYINSCSSRNYPASKVKRAVLHLILNLPAPTRFTKENSYIKVLGFRQSASPLLRLLQKSSRLPVVTNTRNAAHLKGDAKRLYQTELRCDNFYNELLIGQGFTDVLRPEKRNPVIIKDE